jgi:hypothetical protein
MTLTTTPAGWYPDPSRSHELRFFDGGDWTQHVFDGGEVTEAPLGPVPAGLVNWFPPQLMVANANPNAAGPALDVPRTNKRCHRP